MEFPDKDSLKSRYEHYSDEQLLEILKNQAGYQKLAVEVAVEVALSRGLINSREDLPELQFHAQKTAGSPIFPRLNTASQTRKVTKSLMRVVYLVTLFPLIYAGLAYAGGNQLNFIVFGGLGLSWGLLAYQAGQTHRGGYIYLMMLLLVAGPLLFLMLNKFMMQPGIIDLLIWGLSFLLLLYILLYLRLLFARSN
ncbi:hypothetical protein [Gaoshiqia sediminis]|uniref:Uncharacterized protein n=1 Tax=Gaoshiqia sediminis TaxID=2986998 RepID=A0AA42C7V5_9BACT|nr:hypothetical protein [Gaoshiqia sediminis]MCW0482026.1 hypothetical protein [Gaoshiqia sediminis]